MTAFRNSHRTGPKPPPTPRGWCGWYIGAKPAGRWPFLAARWPIVRAILAKKAHLEHAFWGDHCPVFRLHAIWGVAAPRCFRKTRTLLTSWNQCLRSLPSTCHSLSCASSASSGIMLRHREVVSTRSRRVPFPPPACFVLGSFRMNSVR